MGRYLAVGQQNIYSPFDFFHYTEGAPNPVRIWSGTTPGFFSITGKQNDAPGHFNSSDPNADFGDWGKDVGPDAFDAVSNAGLNPVSEAALRVMDVLGYTRTGTTTLPPPSGFSPTTAATEVTKQCLMRHRARPSSVA